METHYRNCEKTKKSMEGVLPMQHGRGDGGGSSSGNQKRNTDVPSHSELMSAPVTSAQFSRMTTEGKPSVLKGKLDYLFAKAIHETGTRADFFEHSAWRNTFQALRANWKPPEPSKITGGLFDDVYKRCAEGTLQVIHKHGGGVIGLNGVVDRAPHSTTHSRALRSVMLYLPIPIFIEFMQCDMRCEHTDTVVGKLAGAVTRLEGLAGNKCCLAFISDSYTLIHAVRSTLMGTKMFKWAYGCAAKSLQNLSMDIAKVAQLTRTVKDTLYICKTVTNTEVLQQLFNTLCVEKAGKQYSLFVYSRTSCISMNDMFKRVLQVRPVLSCIPYALANERIERGIEDSYKMPIILNNLLSSTTFWHELEQLHKLIQPICHSVEFLQSEVATMSDAYANFIYQRMAISRTELLSDPQKEKADMSLLHRWDRIYSALQALAFVCDPFYMDMRQNVSREYGCTFLELGHGNLNEQCHQALRLVATDDEHFEKLMNDFMQFSIATEPLLGKMGDYHARFVWGQLTGQYPWLSVVLVDVFRSPGSLNGFKRVDSISNKILVQRQGRSNGSNGRNEVPSETEQKRMAIAHNSDEMSRSMPMKHSKAFEFFISTLCGCGPSEGSQYEFVGEAAEDDGCAHKGEETYDEDAMMLQLSLADIPDPQYIPDSLIFFNDDEDEDDGKFSS